MAIERRIKGRAFIGTREVYPRPDALAKEESMRGQGFETAIIKVRNGYRVFFRRK